MGEKNKKLSLNITFTIRLPKFQTKVSEAICVKLTVSKKKCCIFFAYIIPQNNNLKTFFGKIKLFLITIVNKCDSITPGDISPNTKSKNNGCYSELCDSFDLTNLKKANTCVKSSNQTFNDVILRNRSRSFHKSGVVTSDCHKMILTFFRSYFSRLPPKSKTFRSFGYFETKDLLYKLENNLRTRECSGTVKYLTSIFRSALNSHVPLKQKQVRQNQAPFLTKELSEAIMIRSRI